MTGKRKFSSGQQGLLVNGVASLGLTATGYASAWFGYEGYPPQLHRQIWAAFSVALFGYWLYVLVAFVAGSGRGRASGRARQVLEFGTFLGVNGVTWLFMPYGTAELQHVTLLFSTSYCAATILSSADEDAFTRWRIGIVMGSLAAVCVIDRIPLWPYLTAYLIILAAVLITFDTMVRRTIGALREAQSEAEQARDVRTRFISAATHDLGQPLQAARLFHEQALRARDGHDREDAAGSARSAFEAMERLLHAMLDHLRLSSGAVSTSVVEIDVRRLFDKLKHQYAAVAALQNMSLAALPTKAVVATDRLLCERVLGNFIDNALRHSRGTRVRIGARRIPEGWRLFVADDGRGLAGEDAPSLFEDFTQGSSGGEGGFGLGLSSARRAAEAIGGVAGHEPRWVKGAQFYLELPSHA